VTVLDALTYAGCRENLGDMFLSPRLVFAEGNILDAALVADLMASQDAVVHFAAESHVDRSFLTAGTFLTVNVLGTQVLLEAARAAGVAKFVQVSTDEVYGPLAEGDADENAPLRPTVPYATSKACADLMALSWFRSYGLPVCVTRSSNNYGPRQHPEKVIPLFITSLLKDQPVTLHGHGQHVRNWLHVEDNCAGIELVLRGGQPGEVYNIGGQTDLSGRQLAGVLLEACGAGEDRITYVPDRRANDIRYAMDWGKITRTLGYHPARPFAAGLAETIEWYRANPDRWAPLLRNPAAALPRIALAAQATP
jgi:dTDP-glucose 4,6-dehydratase